jgi:hypothetical protein
VTQAFAAKLFTPRGQHRPIIYVMRLKVVFTELCWMVGLSSAALSNFDIENVYSRRRQSRMQGVFHELGLAA